MSGSVGTVRAGSNRQSGNKDKMTKSERNLANQQHSYTSKTETPSNKMQPTQEQIRLALITDTKKSEANPERVKELMALTDKSECDVMIALHDAENDENLAVTMLLEGVIEMQGEWREQGGKRKKKIAAPSSQKEVSSHVGDDNFDGKTKDKGEKDEKDRDGGPDHHDIVPRRGRRNGGPPPRLARGRGRDRGNFGDRDNKECHIDEWNSEKGEERRDRSGGDRGRSRGRGGFGGRRSVGGRGRFNNNNDRDSRSYNRVPRFEKMNNSQPIDGPEIDTWTNETAETNTSKDTDWDNWNDTWVHEEDQWTGSLEETKVFTPSQMKVPEPDSVIVEPPSSRGQRVDVGSLFIESAKFSKAPDYTKPSGDAYINQFKQVATESIKNSIGIGSSSRPPQSLNSMTLTQQSMTGSLGLSSLAQSPDQVGVLTSLTHQESQVSISQTMTQLSQMSLNSQQAQIGLNQQAQMVLSSQQAQIGNIGSQQQVCEQAPPSQSRIPSVMQQQQNLPVTSNLNNLQQRPKLQKSKLPPPSKIPASAVEMPGHIPRNPQLDLQFGIDFGSESNSSFGFGANSENDTVPNSYSTTTIGNSSVITNHFNQAHISKPSNDGNPLVSNIMSSPSSGSNKVPSTIESQQSNRQAAIFHTTVYTGSPPKNESQSLDREQSKMSASEPISNPYSSQLEHKSSPLMVQHTGQNTQNLNSGSLSQNKSDSSSSYTTTNGYAPSSYTTHQKSTRTQTQSYTTNSQVSQTSSYQGQYQASQSVYPSGGQGQYSNPPNATQFTPSGQPASYSSAQNQYLSGQNQFVSASNSGHPTMPHASHQYSSGPQNSYTSGQSQYSSYQTSTSFPSHSPSQTSYPSSNQTSGTNASIYPVSTQANNSYTSQTTSYQSPSASSYHPRDTQTNSSVSTPSATGVTFPSAQPPSLKPATSQTNLNYSSQSYSAPPATLQPSQLTNRLGENLSKMALKDETLDLLQTSQHDHSSNNSVTTISTTLSLASATSTTSLSTATTTISSTSTATSITPTSRISSMPSTSKAPPNLPPGVPLMGQYIMSQSTMPPFYSVQPPLYGYEDVQLLQQRMPLQTGSYYDMSAFPAPAGPTIPAGRDQQTPLPSVPFSGTTDTSKMTRVDAQSPNSANQPQNAHSAAQQPLYNFHYSYYYPSVFPGGGLQYPMFPIPPVTNATAHAGTTANTQFQKTYASHVYTTKGYDELNQAQDFSKTGYGNSPTGSKTSGTRTGSSEITPNTYNKSHSQTYDKQGFHGGTPPPFSLPIASATQAGPMGGPTTPYATAPFFPIMAAHQLHHPIQQDSNSSNSRGLNQTGNQAKTGAGKSYGVQYWNN